MLRQRAGHRQGRPAHGLLAAREGSGATARYSVARALHLTRPPSRLRFTARFAGNSRRWRARRAAAPPAWARFAAMQIEGVNALVAGGASGLGAATARRLHEAGANVTIADLNPERGKALADELGARLRRRRRHRRRAGRGRRERRPRATTACASPSAAPGIGWAEKVAGSRGAHAFEPFETVIRVNLIGTFNVLRLAAAAMLANEPNDQGERGVCISTASIAAYDGQIGQIAYSASKGGIVGMTLPAARDLAAVRHPRLRDRPRPLRHAAARRPPRGDPQRARRPGPVPAAARPPRRVRRARDSHRREHDAQRRGHPPRRRAAHAAQVKRYGRTSTFTTFDRPAANGRSGSLCITARNRYRAVCRVFVKR